MAVLKNAKHEKIALGLADGKSQADAYVEAGYSPKAASASATKLFQRQPSIIQRRDEILRERDDMRKNAESSHAVRIVADKAWLIDRAVALVERGMQSAPVLAKDGKPVVIVTEDGEVRPMYGFNDRAVAAGLRIVGLAQGYFVMRHRTEDDLFSQLPPEVTRALRERLLVALQHEKEVGPKLTHPVALAAAPQPRPAVTLENDGRSELGGQPTPRRKARAPRTS